MSTEINAAAEREGLLFLGAVGLEYPEDYRRFQAWIAENRHADLRFLENHRALRAQPRGLLPGARSAVILALPYHDTTPPSGPQVARYARYADYHRVLKEKAERVAAAALPTHTTRVTVDSAPILERALAAKTRRGFIGKNTLYIHPDHGSFLLLGEILTDADLAHDVPPSIDSARKTRDGGCGPCKLCQTACPTGALDRDYNLDAAKCLAYWTIENRGTIPERFWPWLAEYYFGCDLCQLACPYNLKAKGPPDDWKARTYPDLDTVAGMNQAEYEKHFGGTPLTRAKRAGLRRNALIAMAVTRHPGLQNAIEKVKSDGDPVLEATVSQIRGYLLDSRA